MKAEGLRTKGIQDSGFKIQVQEFKGFKKFKGLRGLRV